MSLKKYREKRNFKISPEPQGSLKKEKAKSDLIFVVQKHRASQLHYDFRLEYDGALPPGRRQRAPRSTLP